MSWSRVLVWVIALGIGAMYGAAATITHAFLLGPLPLGLVLAFVGTAALLLAIRLLVEDRWAVLAAGLGMMAVALLFSGRGPGGSVLVPSGMLGTVWTLGLPVIVAVFVAWPRLGGARGRVSA